MKPESTHVLQHLLENFFNIICQQYNLSSDPESHQQLLKSYIREAFPGRDDKFYLEIYSDIWRSVVESAQTFGQSDWGGNGQNELKVNEEIRSRYEDEAPRATKAIGQVEIEKGEIPSLRLVQLALDTIAALGDYLITIGEAKEIELRKEIFATLGGVINKITIIIKELLHKPGHAEIAMK